MNRKDAEKRIDELLTEIDRNFQEISELGVKYQIHVDYETPAGYGTGIWLNLETYTLYGNTTPVKAGEWISSSSTC